MNNSSTCRRATATTHSPSRWWLMLLAAVLLIPDSLPGGVTLLAQRGRVYSPPPRPMMPSGGGGRAAPRAGVPSNPRPATPRAGTPSGTPRTGGTPTGRQPGQPGYTGRGGAVPKRVSGANAGTPRAAASSNATGIRTVTRMTVPPANSPRVIQARAAAKARLTQLRAARAARSRKGGIPVAVLASGDGGRRPPANDNRRGGGGSGGRRGGGGNDGGGDGGDGDEPKEKKPSTLRPAFNQQAQTNVQWLESIKPKVDAKLPGSLLAGARPAGKENRPGSTTIKPVGVEYVQDRGTSVRVMRGSVAGEWPSQKKDYVKVMRNGSPIGKKGQVLASAKDEEAHIPLEEWLRWKSWDKP